MFGTLMHFPGVVSRFVTRAFGTAETRSSSDLVHAAKMMGKNKCPECEGFMTLACIGGGKDAAHTDRCSKCGALWVYGETGVLVAFDGFYKPIRDHYLHSLRMEQAKALELRRAMAHTQFSRSLEEEIESMRRHDELTQELTRLSTYNADEYVRKAA